MSILWNHRLYLGLGVFSRCSANLWAFFSLHHTHSSYQFLKRGISLIWVIFLSFGDLIWCQSSLFPQISLLYFSATYCLLFNDGQWSYGAFCIFLNSIKKNEREIRMQVYAFCLLKKLTQMFLIANKSIRSGIIFGSVDQYVGLPVDITYCTSTMLTTLNFFLTCGYLTWFPLDVFISPLIKYFYHWVLRNFK